MEIFVERAPLGAFSEAPIVVAVDVQVQPLARDSTYDAAIARGALVVRKARELGWPVLLLKMNALGRDNPVMPQLLQEVEQPTRYSGLREVDKTRMGGGQEVIDACPTLAKKKFIIFGFWAWACVIATVRELVSRLPDVEIIVVLDACNEEVAACWRDYEEIPNVRLLYHTDILRAHQTGGLSPLVE